MTEHRLTEVAKEEGQKETRFRATCSCGWLGPDHGAKDMFSRAEAVRKAQADHEIHAKGGDPTEAADHEANPGVKDWSDKIRREGR